MNAATIVRITIANIDAQTLARALAPFGFSGTISNTLGFGEWGTEPGVTLESVTDDPDNVLSVVSDILRARGEECAYVTLDGASPSLLYPANSADLPFTLAGL